MIISAVTPKTWNNTNFVELTIDGKIYACWQKAGQTLKAGDTIEGEIVDKGAGKTPQIKIKSVNGQELQTKGSIPKGDPKSFAASYAKDIAVAYIAMGKLTQTTETDAILEHYYKWFLTKMEG